MNLNVIISSLTLLGFGGIIGAYFNHLFEKKKEIELHIRERKEDQYKKFLENLLGFFEGWHNKERKKNFMEELYTHAPLYASSEVIRLSNIFLSSFNDKDMSKGGKSDSYYRKLVIAIRKDMGVWERNKLSEKDVDIQMLNEIGGS